MKNTEDYYIKTSGANPHKNIIEFINKTDVKPGIAIDLGCGAGRDTLFLLNCNWRVYAVDREDTSQLIKSQLPIKYVKNFEFIHSSFSEFEFLKNDLTVANYSLPFCHPAKFKLVWNRLVESIKPNGYFVGNFFGINDDWNKDKKNMMFMNETDVKSLFDKFNILKFCEEECDSKTAIGMLKHWHTYEVIAQKNMGI